MHSSSSATALRIASSYLKLKKQQQKNSGQELRDGLTHKDQEQCDGFSTKRKLLCTNPSYQGKKIWMGIRYDCWAVVFCWLPLRVLVWFLVSLASLSPFWLPVSLGDVAPNRRILVFEFEGIQHSISLCDISCLFSVLWSSPQDKMHCQLSLTVGLCTPCQKSKLHQYNRFFFRGVMTPSLLPVRPGLHSTDVGLFWVCHCHCHCRGELAISPWRLAWCVLAPCLTPDRRHGTLLQHTQLTMQHACCLPHQPSTSGRHTHSETSNVLLHPNLSSLRYLLAARCSNPRCALRTPRLTSAEVDARSLSGNSISLHSCSAPSLNSKALFWNPALQHFSVTGFRSSLAHREYMFYLETRHVQEIVSF